MYKVILIDDERWSLEGLVNVFPWEEMGFQVIAQFTDSRKAFDMIARQNPEVIVTDIRMPNISGLELIKRVREMKKKSEFVIISGYDDFKYAQQALQLGAFDYRLKPIEPDDARRLLQNLKKHIDEKCINDDIDLFEALSNSANNPYELLSDNGFTISGNTWLVLAIRSQHPIERKSIDVLLKNINYLPLWIGKDKLIAICNEDQSTLQNYLDNQLVNASIRYNWHIGLSRLSQSIDKISLLLRESDMASCRYFIYEKPGIATFNSNNIAIINNITNQIGRYISNLNKQKVIDLIKMIPRDFVANNLGMLHAVELWNRFVVLFRDWAPGALADLELDYLDYSEMIYKFQNIKEMTEYIEKVFLSYYDPYDVNTSSNINDNFLALLSDVKQNYMNTISLGDLSQKYFLNFSYCSELFTKVTGQTFSNYVTSLRMNKARELLKIGKYTAQQVSELVGYNDYYYFSKRFKKLYGISPIQYNQLKKLNK